MESTIGCVSESSDYDTQLYLYAVENGLGITLSNELPKNDYIFNPINE